MMRCFGLLLVVPLLVACNDEVDDNQVVGDLGNGTFTYVCVDSSDPLCPSGGSASGFPDRVGLGGVFDLEFEPLDEDDVDRTRIESVAMDIIDTRNEQFFANDLGVVALLAKRMTDGRVLDLVHMSVAAVMDVELDSNGDSPRVVYTVGQREQLSATAVDSQGAPLAGAREFTWAVSNGDLLRLERASPSAQMELMPLGPGTVSIHVTTGEASTTLEVTIEGTARDAGIADGAAPEGGPQGDGGPDASDGRRGTDAGDGGARDAGSLIDAAPVSDADTGDGG